MTVSFLYVCIVALIAVLVPTVTKCHEMLRDLMGRWALSYLGITAIIWMGGFLWLTLWPENLMWLTAEFKRFEMMIIFVLLMMWYISVLLFAIMHKVASLHEQSRATK